MTGRRRLVWVAAVCAVLVFSIAATAAAAPVTIKNDVGPAEQFNVTGAESELHAHGGGMLKFGNYYYWYGEWRNTNSTINRVPVYRSTDLKNWEYRGAALDSSQVSHLTNPNIERPKVIYNALTDKFVMWMHLEMNGNYSSAHAAVAVSDNGPEGPFVWQWNGRIDRPVTGSAPANAQNGPPHMSRDMTVFVDDDNSGYLISSVDDNRDMHIYKLTDDFTNVAPTGHYLVWNDQWREAPIMFKRNGVYFLLTSGATGWSPNLQMYATSTNINGGAAAWTQPTPVPFANQSAWETQGAHLITLQGTEGTSYLYLADRWAGSFNGGNPNNSKYVWLPLEFPTDRSLDMPWADEITIDTATGEVSGRQNDPPEGIKWPIRNLSVGSTSDADQGTHHPFIHGSHFNNAANMVDGRQETNWISTGTQANAWAQFDLGETRTVDHLRLMLFRGGIRTYQLEVLAGNTSPPATSVWTGSLANKTGFHEIEFDAPVQARYLRVRVTGAGSGDTSNENRMAPGSSLGIVEAEVYNTGASTPENCTPLRSDDFNGGSLSTAKWSFQHPTTPTTGENAPEVSGGKLRLRAVQGELPDGNISFVGQPVPPGDHWTVTTKLDFNPNASWQHAGLMLYADNNNYARLTFTRNNSNGQRFFEMVSYVNGTRTQSSQGYVSANHGNTAVVRLQRIGSQLSARFQAVGASFHTQGGVWLPQEKSQMTNFLGSVNLTTNTRVVEGAVVGPYAGGGVAGTNPVAEFDYFQVGPDDELALCGVDVTAPVSTAGLDPAVPDGNNGWYRTAPTVNIVASDDLDAEPDIEYRLADSGGFTSYTAPFTDNREGSSLILQHRATDAAGNSAWVKTVNWKRDATPPVTEIEYVPEPVPLIVGTLPRELPDGSYSAAYSYRFDVEASDSLSGVESTEYCIGTHESPCDPEWPVEDGEIVIGGIGNHLVRYRSVDAAGNVEETREFSIRIVQHPHNLHVVGLPDTVKFGGPVSFFIDTDLDLEPLYDLPLEFVVNGDCTLEPAGDPIPDTGWPMRLVPHGAGSCTFTAHHPGAYDVIAPAESEPFTVTIGKAKPDVSVKISPKKVKSGKKLTVKVQVKAPGIVGGKVKVKVGGKTKTVKVNNAGKGTLKIKVKGKKGKKLKVQATYAGNSNVASAKSKAVKATFK